MSNQFSHNNNNSHNNSNNNNRSFTPGQLRLKDKQREQIAFNKILIQSSNLVQFLNEFADTYDTLGGGSEAVAGVVQHWQNVFRVTHLALASLESKKIPISTEDDTLILPPGTLPDRLVRIPVSDL